MGYTSFGNNWRVNLIYNLFTYLFIIIITHEMFCRKCKLHKKITERDSEIPVPNISIIKPLMGVDPNLYTNLETFFTMTYPTVSEQHIITIIYQQIFKKIIFYLLVYIIAIRVIVLC